MNKIVVSFSIVLFGAISKFAHAELLKDQVYDSNGSQRTYDLYLPAKRFKKLSPLVLFVAWA